MVESMIPNLDLIPALIAIWNILVDINEVIYHIGPLPSLPHRKKRPSASPKEDVLG